MNYISVYNTSNNCPGHIVFIPIVWLEIDEILEFLNNMNPQITTSYFSLINL